jgi:hypothetical protein
MVRSMSTNVRADWMTTRDVAREIGITEVSTRRNDGALRPVRTSTGIRLYDSRRVAEFAARRDAVRDARRR